MWVYRLVHRLVYKLVRDVVFVFFRKKSTSHNPSPLCVCLLFIAFASPSITHRNSFRITVVENVKGHIHWCVLLFCSGWGSRIRTYACRIQSPKPYHLAIPQYEMLWCGLILVVLFEVVRIQSPLPYHLAIPQYLNSRILSKVSIFASFYSIQSAS